ncbi:MAG: TlpA family protein disulfide reductase [Rubrivivax sp.]|jgi:thiol-disulfide isomerase/thioredoxin|nr:TlpA family protein disulfide reductase [Rubrivivax sp.]
MQEPHDENSRRRTRRRLLTQGAGLAAWTAASAAAPTWAQPTASVGDPGGPPPAPGTKLDLPDVTLFDGRRFTQADADGQVLVLYWWASWCPFCAVQSPLMEKLWLAERRRGLRFLGLSIDRTAEDAVAYLAKRGVTFPSTLVTPAIARALPKPRGLPVTVVRGRDGRVLMGEAGQLFPEDVEQIADFL